MLGLVAMVQYYEIIKLYNKNGNDDMLRMSFESSAIAGKVENCQFWDMG